MAPTRPTRAREDHGDGDEDMGDNDDEGDGGSATTITMTTTALTKMQITKTTTLTMQIMEVVAAIVMLCRDRIPRPDGGRGGCTQVGMAPGPLGSSSPSPSR